MLKLILYKRIGPNLWTNRTVFTFTLKSKQLFALAVRLSTKLGLSDTTLKVNNKTHIRVLSASLL